MFSYQIQPGNEDTNGITIGSIFLNGGSIKDFLGTDVNLTLNNVGSTAGVLVDAVRLQDIVLQLTMMLLIVLTRSQ